MKRKMAFALDFIQFPQLLMILLIMMIMMIMLRKRYALVSGLTKTITGRDGGPDRRSEIPTAAEKLGKYFPSLKMGLNRSMPIQFGTFISIVRSKVSFATDLQSRRRKGEYLELKYLFRAFCN